MIVTMQDYTITDRAPVLIGYEGENLSRNFTVETADDLSGIASIELLLGDVNCGAMTVNTDDTEITISLDAFMIGRAGYKKAQLIMLDDTGAVVMKSNQFDVLVGASNNPRYFAAGEKVKTLTVNIDGRTRQIILPAGFAVSVNGDVAVDHIAFKAPASYGDFDFSSAACRVDWTGVDGTSHTNICTEKDADGNWIWALPTALTRGGEGEIAFSVSYVVTDNGAVTADWNTGLVKFYHLESAKSDDAEEDVEEETTYDRLASAIAAVQAAQASVDDVNAILAGITSATPTVVETVADLNGLDTSKVKLAIVAADGYLYYYNGTAWVSGFAYGGLQEVIAARTDSDGVTHADLKTRLNTAEAQIKEDLSAHDARITELENGGSGGLSKTAVNLLNTILSEAVYGTDQTANIELLNKELSNVKPVSITATLTSRALVGMRYSELTFEVTATFDDESTATVTDGYRVTTTGTVHSGANTVTVSYKGVTTNVTFEAEQVVTHAITYNLTDVTSSNNTTVVVDGAYYSTVLSVPTDYGFNGCTVTMGGVDITDTAFANMEILITEVTGDVVITASATEFIYLDDLLPTREGGFTNLNGYPNGTTEDTPVLRGNYNYAPFVSEYPALTDCTIHWKIKNISDSDVSLDVCGFGNINPDNTYGADASVIRAFYCVKADNSSHILTPGAELEGDVTVKSGMQLCFICKYADFSNFEIKLRGNYTPNTFDGYGEVNPTNSNTSAYGNYRTVTYYKDNGSEELTKTSNAPRKIEVALEAGTYDMYCCVQATTITGNVRNTQAIVGGMSATTDTIINYAGGRKEFLGAALWHHSAFTLSDSNMTFVLGGNISAIDNTNATLRIMYKKVVSA